MGLMFELRASGLQSRPIEPYLQSIYSGYFVDAGAGGGLSNYLPGLASNHDPSNLSLPSHYD
jgi:hypothetical protein